MKLIALLLSIAFSTIVNAQPGEILSYFEIRVYDSNGKLIGNENANYKVKFEKFPDRDPKKITRSQSSVSASLQLSINEPEFTNDGFRIILEAGYSLKATFKSNHDSMIFITSGSIDSIRYTPGTYVFNKNESALLNIRLNKEVVLENYKLSNFAKGSGFANSTFSSNEMEYSSQADVNQIQDAARELEEKHDGTNWAFNICPDNYESPELYKFGFAQPVYISDDSVIQTRCVNLVNEKRSESNYIIITPLNRKKYIMHEILSGDTHFFSVSNDSCKTWSPLLQINNIFYVGLVYFINEDFIGIDCGNFLLLTDHKMKKWKYFLNDWDLKRQNKNAVPQKTNSYQALYFRNYEKGDSSYKNYVLNTID